MLDGGAAATGGAGPADADPDRHRRRRLFDRRRDPQLAAAAVPRPDLARAGVNRGGVSLRGDPVRRRIARAAPVKPAGVRRAGQPPRNSGGNWLVAPQAAPVARSSVTRCPAAMPAALPKPEL